MAEVTQRDRGRELLMNLLTLAGWLDPVDFLGRQGGPPSAQEAVTGQPARRLGVIHPGGLDRGLLRLADDIGAGLAGGNIPTRIRSVLSSSLQRNLQQLSELVSRGERADPNEVGRAVDRIGRVLDDVREGRKSVRLSEEELASFPSSLQLRVPPGLPERVRTAADATLDEVRAKRIAVKNFRKRQAEARRAAQGGNLLD